VLTRQDHDGDHFVGYFSKEKHSFEGYNLAVITILPAYQRKGYGRLLIEFSYELSKLEQKVCSLLYTQVGSPELPLSDLGYAGYRSFWAAALIDTLTKNVGMTFTIEGLSRLTSIRGEDILATLADLGLLSEWRGDRGVSVGVEGLKTCVEERGVRVERALKVDGMVRVVKKCF
jgi:hypothetical protein